jgi:AGCS family alanine or glycine:cation symporter
MALQSETGNVGPVFVAVAILLFAYSSIIGNYYYGEANVRYLTKSNSVMTVYRIFSAGVFVFFGALASLELAWSMIDFCMALLTICNLVAIVALGRYVFRLVDDYLKQRRQGIKDPVFHRSQIPEIEKDIDCWE